MFKLPTFGVICKAAKDNTNTFPRPAFGGPEHLGKTDLTALNFIGV